MIGEAGTVLCVCGAPAICSNQHFSLAWLHLAFSSFATYSSSVRHKVFVYQITTVGGDLKNSFQQVHISRTNCFICMATLIVHIFLIIVPRKSI